MIITIDQAILSIQRHIRIHKIGSPPHIYIAEALNMAIDALREKEERENPQPLTMEELKKMDVEPVYVVPINNTCKIPEWCVYENEYETAYIPGYEGWQWNLNDYGETWIAYRHKPKEK